MTTYYGFKSANRAEQSAWFHTRVAAERFNAACGGILGEIETSGDSPVSFDVLDTVSNPWRLESPVCE